MKKLTLLIALSVLLYSAPGNAAGNEDPEEELQKALSGKEPAAAAALHKDGEAQTDEMTPAAAEELAPLFEKRREAVSEHMRASIELSIIEKRLQEMPEETQDAKTTQNAKTTQAAKRVALEKLGRTCKRWAKAQDVVERVRVKHGLPKKELAD